MNRRYSRVLAAVVLGACLPWLVVFAQVPSVSAPQDPAKKPAGGAQKASAPAQAPAVPEKEQTPSEKALAEARKVTDPDKKVEALRQLIKEFPKSDEADSANYLILTTLNGKVKEDAKKVLEQMKVLIEAEPEDARGQVYGNMASQLVAQDILLDEAEGFATKALELMTEERYLAERNRAFTEMNARRLQRDPKATPLEVPSNDDLHRMFLGEKQSITTTLGQVYLRRGKLAEAERTLREAYRLDPKGYSAATAAAKLAEFAKATGRDAEQLEFLSVVALAGRLTADTRKDLEVVYRKLHNGSVDGLEEMLDARYEKETQRPVKVQPYQKAAGRTDRVVLAEVFTGAGCGPCVGADFAFEAALERYQPTELAVLMYHLHVPRPDPMSNPAVQARAEKLYNIRGVPSFFIDGESDGKGGGSLDMAGKIYKERVEPVVEKQLVTKAEAKLGLTASRSGSTISVMATVETRTAAKNLKLHLALVEERVRYSGENGVRFHPMVVRALAASAKDVQGFAVQAGKRARFDYVFDLDAVVREAKAHLDEFPKASTRFPGHVFVEKRHEVNQAKLAVVAFLQDEDTKKVLQAVVVKPGV